MLTAGLAEETRQTRTLVDLGGKEGAEAVDAEVTLVEGLEAGVAGEDLTLGRVVVGDEVEGADDDLTVTREVGKEIPHPEAEDAEGDQQRTLVPIHVEGGEAEVHVRIDHVGREAVDALEHALDGVLLDVDVVGAVGVQLGDVGVVGDAGREPAEAVVEDVRKADAEE